MNDNYYLLRINSSGETVEGRHRLAKLIIKLFMDHQRFYTCYPILSIYENEEILLIRYFILYYETADSTKINRTGYNVLNNFLTAVCSFPPKYF